MNMEKEMQPAVAAKMSKRLITIANMLSDSSEEVLDNNTLSETMHQKGGYSHNRVADVGCDHGYISIYLVQSGIAKSAIAMDVRKGPLMGAQSNVKGYGLENSIETRLSDGLKELKPGEADSLIIAGMGGKLMKRILEDGDSKALGIRTAILQPQSELSEFRMYLRDNGYAILDERVVLEDGKYYFPMKVLISGADDHTFEQTVSDLIDKTGCDEETAISICNRYGECNIIRKDPLLKSYLEHGMEVGASIIKGLDEATHPDRYHEVARANRENEKLFLYLTK